MVQAHAPATVVRMGSSATEPVTWRRHRGPAYVGAVALGEGYVRLVGRDPDSSLEVSLSIPFGEIGAVRARRSGEVVLELSGSQAIRLRGTGDRAALPRVLARWIRSGVSRA